MTYSVWWDVKPYSIIINNLRSPSTASPTGKTVRSSYTSQRPSGFAYHCEMMGPMYGSKCTCRISIDERGSNAERCDWSPRTCVDVHCAALRLLHILHTIRETVNSNQLKGRLARFCLLAKLSAVLRHKSLTCPNSSGTSLSLSLSLRVSVCLCASDSVLKTTNACISDID